MSFSKEALEYINQQAVQRTEIKSDFAGIVLPEKTAIHSLEILQKFRNRFIGTFSTLSIADFAAYVNKHSGAQCFINSKKPVATAIFDLGTPEQPGHAQHKAKLELETTPDYEALCVFANQRHTQQELAEFLEDWKLNITATDTNGDEMDVKTAITAVRRVTVEAKKAAEHTIGTMSTSKSSLEQMDARSGNSPLPAWVTFHCIPYHGLKQYDFHMRMSLTISDAAIGFRLLGSNFAQIRQEYQNEFMALVQKTISDKKTSVYIGNFEPK